jgi:hypothetical protein
MSDRRLVWGALLVALSLTVRGVGQSQNPSSGNNATKQQRAPASGSTTPGSPPTDVELVERVLAARHDYMVALQQLLTHYISVNDAERVKWAQEELMSFHRIKKQAYRLDLDVPPPTLRAMYNIPEANQLYIKAMEYKDKGWSTDYIDNQRRAEMYLQQLLSSYPQSDKIGDTAYQLGDLYEGKAYQMPRRAAMYFERCFQWQAHAHTDARIRAARLYDKVLLERSHAIELYQEVMQHETDPKMQEEAKKRLAELKSGR